MSSKEIKLQNSTFLFIEVPEGINSFRLWEAYSNFNQEKGSYVVFEYDTTNIYFRIGEVESFVIISTTKNITEEQAESIVERSINVFSYRNYLWNNHIFKDRVFKTAKESLQSLIQANGLELNKNYLIIRKYDK